MPKAYSYIRFSTKIQSKGDSLRRQQILAENYIKDNSKLNLILDTELNMLDLGVSAYKGSNVEDGNLGRFLEAINNGKIDKGSYLLVENLDRLSRKKIGYAQAQFMEILKNGIIIVTLSDRKKFDIDDLDMTDLIISLTYMLRAHEESATKSVRIREGKNAKKVNIINGNTDLKLGKWTPTWLTLSSDRKHFIVDEERADIVRQIFEWSADGYGIRKTIQRLEEMNIKPFVHRDIKVGRIPKRWNNGILLRWFTDRRVLGEYTLTTDAGGNQKQETVIKDYFPRIVADELYYRAEDARKKRSVRGGGRKGTTLTNLFAKLAVCGYSTDSKWGGHRCAGDNEYMIYANKDRHLRYLICSRKITGNTGCEECNKYWRYENFELSFLTHIRDIDVSVLIGQPSQLKQKIENINKSISVKKGKRSSIKKQHDKLINRVSSNADLMDMFEEELLSKKDQQDVLSKDISQLTSTVKSKQYEYDNSDDKQTLLSEYINKMHLIKGQELYDLRLKLSELLKSVIERIEVYSKGRVTTYDDVLKWKFIKNEKEAKQAFDIIEQGVKEFGIEPFFVVYYKSKRYSHITPDVKNPTKIMHHMSTDIIGSNMVMLGEAFSGDFESLDKLRAEWNKKNK